METAQLFASQWDELKKRRQEIAYLLSKLKVEIDNLSSSSIVEPLFEEKIQLEKCVKKMQKTISDHKYVIDGKRLFLKKRRLLGDNVKNPKHLDEILYNRRERLDQFNAMGTPQLITETKVRISWAVKAPINEVEKVLYAEIAKEEQEMQLVADTLKITFARIAEIDEQCCLVKIFLKEKMAEVELWKKDHKEKEDTWATQSQRHLKWVIDHEPFYKDRLLSIYQAKFPQEDLSGILTQNSPSLVPTQKTPTVNKKKSRSNGVPDLPKPAEAKEPAPWKFWVTFKPGDLGQELPVEEDAFTKTLAPILKKQNLHNLRADLVYDELMIFIAKGEIGRRKNRIVKRNYMGLLKGWKIIEVTGEHRLFLCFNEKDRWIRFLPRPRSNAYARRD